MEEQPWHLQVLQQVKLSYKQEYWVDWALQVCRQELILTIKHVNSVINQELLEWESSCLVDVQVLSCVQHKVDNVVLSLYLDVLHLVRYNEIIWCLVSCFISYPCTHQIYAFMQVVQPPIITILKYQTMQ